MDIAEECRDPRVIRVAEWILAGMRLSQIPTHIQDHKDQWPGEPPTHQEILEFVQEAHALIEGDAEVDPRREQAKAIGRLNFLYAKCCAIQDYKGAASIQKELNVMVARVATQRRLEH